MVSKTDRMLKSMRAQIAPKQVPIANDMFLPNHSGISDHEEFKQAYGCINAHNVESDIILATQDDWFQITSFDNNSRSNGNVIPDFINNRLIINESGDFQVSLSISGHAHLPNDYEIGVRLNNGVIMLGPLTIHQTTTTNKTASSSVLCFTALSKGDFVEAWIKRNDGADVSKTYTVDHIVLNAIKLNN